MGIETEEPNQKPPTFWQMLHSVMAAAFGVQSGRNRARDFTHGKPVHFIMLGLLFTLVFVLLLAGIVKLVLSLSGLCLCAAEAGFHWWLTQNTAVATTSRIRTKAARASTTLSRFSWVLLGSLMTPPVSCGYRDEDIERHSPVKTSAAHRSRKAPLRSGYACLAT